MKNLQPNHYLWNRSRWMSQQAQLTYDDIPDNSEMSPEERMRFLVDSTNFFNEQYIRAEAFNPDAPMTKVKLFDVESVVLMSHDLAKQWQMAELRGQTKQSVPPFLDDLFGAREVTDNKLHINWKKNSTPPCKPMEINKYTPIVQEAAQRLILDGIAKKSQETGDYVQVHPIARRFAFGVGIKFVLGPYITEEEIEYANSVWNKMSHNLKEFHLDPERKDPRSALSRAFRARDAMHVFLADKFLDAEQLVLDGKWEETWGDEECLLKSMMENGALVEYEDGTLYDRLQIILGLVNAAYDTTATTIANMIYVMWKHPEETEKLRDAILAHPQLSDPDAVFSIAMLKSCPELDCFIHEMQRHYGLVPSIMREITDPEGVDFGGITIPKGATVMVPVRWLHTGPGSWTEPMEFKPSRFDKSKGQTKEERGDIGRYNSVPFGTGLHKCLGEHLALMELRTYATLLLRDWEFELDESKLSAQGTRYEKNMDGFPHFNSFVKLRRRK